MHNDEIEEKSGKEKGAVLRLSFWCRWVVKKKVGGGSWRQRWVIYKGKPIGPRLQSVYS